MSKRGGLNHGHSRRGDLFFTIYNHSKWFVCSIIPRSLAMRESIVIFIQHDLPLKFAGRSFQVR